MKLVSAEPVGLTIFFANGECLSGLTMTAMTRDDYFVTVTAVTNPGEETPPTVIEFHFRNPFISKDENTQTYVIHERSPE